MDKDIKNEGASWIIFSMTQIAKEKVHYGFSAVSAITEFLISLMNQRYQKLVRDAART